MAIEKKTLFFTMVHHPLKGWMRVGNAYGKKDSAKSWLSFISKAWKGYDTKVDKFVLELIDGKPSELCRQILSDTYNLEV